MISKKYTEYTNETDVMSFRKDTYLSIQNNFLLDLQKRSVKALNDLPREDKEMIKRNKSQGFYFKGLKPKIVKSIELIKVKMIM